MQFCPNCENLLYPKQKNNNFYLICNFCDYQKNMTKFKENLSEEYRISEHKNHFRELETVEEEPLPKKSFECPKCYNKLALYSEKYNEDVELLIVYRCTKCKHTVIEA